MTREHFWPQWLIERTNTVATGVKWSGGKKINPKAATFPLCQACNAAFGAELESPVKAIFDDLENERGISDFEAELLIRWLWKFEGLVWLMQNPKEGYSRAYQLRDRVLNRLGGIRSHLSLAVSLILRVDPRHGDAPLGICSINRRNAIFVSAVISKVAIMCFLSEAAQFVPSRFSVYRLLEGDSAPTSTGKLFYPKIGFADDNEAVGVTRLASPALDGFHEAVAESG
ncbi:MAG: hypothetical protein NVV63_18260 [Opitutus sp.]|nr:hypothetical protein [Opitutus sp.]